MNPGCMTGCQRFPCTTVDDDNDVLLLYAIAFDSVLGLRKQFGLGRSVFCTIYMLDTSEDFYNIYCMYQFIISSTGQ